MSPLGWILELIAEAGYSGAELVINHNADTRQPERIAELASSAGIDIPAVHGPFMLLMRNVLGANYLTKAHRSLELASAVGASVMVAHAPFRWERATRRALESELEGELGGYDAVFAMENLYPFAGQYFSSAITPEDLLPYRHVVFDTSHFAVSGIDLFAAWDALADRVVHLHVSDNFGNGRDSHAPIGAGVLPLQEFLAHVGASGYAGAITLELDLRAHLEDRQTLVAFLAGEREKVQRYLTGDVRQEPAGLPS